MQSPHSPYDTSSARPPHGAFPPRTAAASPARRSRVGWILLAVAALGVVPCVVAVVVALVSQRLAPHLARQAGVELTETRRVPGNPARFDAVGALDAVAAWAGPGAVLLRLNASQVRVDGTVPLTATWQPGPDVQYEFLVPTEAPANAPPVGAGGSVDGRWYRVVTVRAFEPGQRRQVTRQGGARNVRYSYVNEGMTRDVGSVIGRAPRAPAVDPRRCPFSTLWQSARAAGVGDDAVASIDVDDDGFTLHVVGQGVTLRFDGDCQARERGRALRRRREITP